MVLMQIKSNSLAEVKKQLTRSEEKLERLELLLKISRKVAGLSNLKDILFAIISETTAQLNADRGTLFLNEMYASYYAKNIFQRRRARLSSMILHPLRNIYFPTPSSHDPLFIHYQHSSNRLHITLKRCIYHSYHL